MALLCCAWAPHCPFFKRGDYRAESLSDFSKSHHQLLPPHRPSDCGHYCHQQKVNSTRGQFLIADIQHPKNRQGFYSLHISKEKVDRANALMCFSGRTDFSLKREGSWWNFSLTPHFTNSGTPKVYRSRQPAESPRSEVSY